MFNLDDSSLIINRLSAIFIFTLIISGNYIGELFPCKIQRILSKNMFLKHFLGLMTLYFFAVITVPELKTIKGLFISSFLYILFLINAKTNYKIWIAVMLIYAFLYLTNMFRDEILSYISVIHNNSSLQNNNINSINTLKIINGFEWLCVIISLLLTITGSLIYIGEKKIEYGKKFSWFTFWTGNPKCRLKTPVIKENFTLIKAAFS